MRIWKLYICNRIRSFVVFRSRCLFSSLSPFLLFFPSPFLLFFPISFPPILPCSLPPCLPSKLSTILPFFPGRLPAFSSTRCFTLLFVSFSLVILHMKTFCEKKFPTSVELIRRNVSPDMFAISPKIFK